MNNITDSYVEGFCKAAEEYGIDPAVLLKKAIAIPGFAINAGKALMKATKAPRAGVRQAYGAAKNGLSRYKELLSGSKLDRFEDYDRSLTNLASRFRNDPKMLARVSKMQGINRLNRISEAGKVNDARVYTALGAGTLYGGFGTNVLRSAAKKNSDDNGLKAAPAGFGQEQGPMLGNHGMGAYGMSPNDMVRVAPAGFGHGFGYGGMSGGMFGSNDQLSM